MPENAHDVAPRAGTDARPLAHEEEVEGFTFLAQATRSLTACDGHEALAEMVVGLAVPAIADLCTLHLDDGGEPPRPAAERQANLELQKQVRELEQRRPGTLSGAAEEAMRTGRASVLGGGSAALEPFATLGCRSVLALPLGDREHALGALTLILAPSSEREFGERDVRLAEAFAAIAALALGGTRLREEERVSRLAAQRAAQRSDRLQRSAAAFSNALTPDQVAEVALSEGLAAAGARTGALFLLDAGARQLQLLREGGSSPRHARERGRMSLESSCLPGEVARTGEARFLEGPEAVGARDRALAELMAEAGTRSIAVLPLHARDQVTGVLLAEFAESGAFGTGDRQLCAALARQCAQALERSRLFVAERRARAEAVAARRRLDFLDRAGQVLARSLDIEPTLRGLGRTAVPELADVVGVYLQEPGGVVRCVALEGGAADAPGLKRIERAGAAVPTGEMARVLRTGEPALVLEGEAAALDLGLAWKEWAGAPGPRSAMLLPLEARGRMLGAVVLVSTDPMRRHGPEDLALAQSFARRAALLLDNALLYQEARAAVAARDEFLSVASHELRTPLSSLTLALQAVSRGKGVTSPAGIAHKLKMAERQAERLARLVDKLLDLSGISAGRLDLQLEEVDLAAVAREVVARMSEEAVRSRSRVSVEAPWPVLGFWDRMRLEQVLTNLLSNALKYGRAQPVDVAVSIEGERARLCVRDRGLGIPIESQRRIFDRFERAVSGRHYGGLGLGLWIVRQIVEALGGSIEVASVPGIGSTFTVWLPLRSAPPTDLGLG